MTKVAIITGCDNRYSDMAHNLAESLAGFSFEPYDADLIVMSYGLSSANRDRFARLGMKVSEHGDILPTGPGSAGFKMGDIGRSSRPILPRLFPSYDVYVWLDADISVASGAAIISYIQAAERHQFAIAREEHPAYRRSWSTLRWHYGGLLRRFKFLDALKLARATKVNAGIMAATADAPHWNLWNKRYIETVNRSGRVTNQHALMAAMWLDGCGGYLMPASFNWICTNAVPWYREDMGLFVVPWSGEVIQILHWANCHDRADRADVRCLGGKHGEAIRNMRLAF